MRPSLVLFLLFFSGCAALFGWDIHAPGILSSEFNHAIQPAPKRIGLYIEPSSRKIFSKDRGSRLSDPQTYHIGEAFEPMLVEGFQQGFQEFVFLELEPTAALLKQYGIPYVAAVRVKDFENRKGKPLHRQVVSVWSETYLYDDHLNLLVRFESRGTSDARKVFAKKGGPEVNLNAAIENNVRAVVLFLQDWFKV